MNNKSLKMFTLALVPVSLLLAGCWTNPAVLKPAIGAPSFTGGIVIVDSGTVKATVASMDVSNREVILSFKDGTTTTNVVGPEAVNLDQINVGDTVQADISRELAIFIVKNGPLPDAGSGVLVQRAAKGAEPAGMILATHDYSARVIQADRSYRLLTLKYQDGSVKTFKVPLPFTLEHVAVGDNVMVRTTRTIALHILPKKA